MNCMFSGETPENEEHIIPKWLQKRFSLYEQSLYIPNGTTLPYKFAKVPVKREHNNEFSKIENKISQGVFDLDEVYLWALKIHIGMLYRDSSLKADQKLPTSPTLLNIGDFASEIGFFRMLYDLWRKGGKTNPNPIGSVFIFESLMPNSTFDFIHCFETGTVCINIGDKFLTIFLWDQADGYRSNIKHTWNNYHKTTIDSIRDKKEKSDKAYFAQHVWACESSYWLYRNRRSFNFIMANNSLTLVPPLNRLPTSSMDEFKYRAICRSFGLELSEFKGETGNIYSQFDVEGFLNK